PTLGDFLRHRRDWVAGQGFQPSMPGSGEPLPDWWSPETPFLDVRKSDFDLVLLRSDCEKVGSRFRCLHRPRQRRLYQPPMVLITKGSAKAAFCNHRVLFRDTVYSIAGPKEDEPRLMFLAGVLSSRMSRYILFHTAASLGIERNQIRVGEIKRLPFPMPDETESPSQASIIIDDVAHLINSLIGGLTGVSREQMTQLVEEAKNRIDQLVYEYFNITKWEKIFIDETIDYIQDSATPSSPSKMTPLLRPAMREDREQYTRLLCELLNSWSSQTRFVVGGRVLVSDRLGLGIVTLFHGADKADYTEVTGSKEIERVLKRLREVAQESHRRFRRIYDLTLFEENEIYLIKPLAIRHWMCTAAMNDADKVAAAILST
ncbi:MAG: hypothetical protein ABIK83_01965, partial [Candidatus Zixiibacteriota bacterium]